MTILHLRKSIGRSPLRRGFLLVTLALACFALSPAARAVSPAPDGGYPNNNTAEGTNALFSLTTGFGNTALGFDALFFNATGIQNTATGGFALYSNTGNYNTANGRAALFSNTSGTQNTATGAFTLYSNTTGNDNTAVGWRALGSSNSFLNTAVGWQALLHNTTGNENTANGAVALFNNTTGVDNTANGDAALHFNTTGDSNTANGAAALENNTKGFENTADGADALLNNTTGSYNIALGVLAGLGVTTANSVICIGSPGENVSNSCYIGQIFGVTSTGGTAVFINSAGKLGTTTSSRRFKDEIKPMDKASKAIFTLKPVTFFYKKEIEPQRIPQFGLVAEEVEKVNPALITRDRDGKPYTVRYEAVNAMLLNEFLKEHHQVQEQQKQIENLSAQLKEQAEQIRKVSDKVEMSRPAPQMVGNNE